MRDNGIGIAAEALARIFEMFSREGREDVRAQGGLGIGLTLSRRLAEMHGGTIEARSAGDRARRGIHRPPAARVRPAMASPTPVKLCRLAAPMRMLVVDDNRDAADSLGMLLRMLGVDVRPAHDGPAALEAFAFGDPAVVLLDIGMPGMDGYEVARRRYARASRTGGRRSSR